MSLKEEKRETKTHRRESHKAEEVDLSPVAAKQGMPRIVGKPPEARRSKYTLSFKDFGGNIALLTL